MGQTLPSNGWKRPFQRKHHQLHPRRKSCRSLRLVPDRSPQRIQNHHSLPSGRKRPKKAPRLSPSSRSSKTTSVAAAAPKATRGRGRKARIRPEERLLRKKEQNKTAATRYREKKKMELGVAHEQQMELENQNRKLKRQHDSLVQELRFMKKLAR